MPETEVTRQGGTKYDNFDTDAALMYTYTPDAAADVPAIVTGYYGAGRMNHGDFTHTFKDNTGNDTTDSAYDAVLGALLDNYTSALVGIFSDENLPTSIAKPSVGDGRMSAYRLDGKRTANTDKGLYIIGGRKVLIK